MSYMTRTDIPYHYALAMLSLWVSISLLRMGPTNPNRTYYVAVCIGTWTTGRGRHGRSWGRAHDR